MGTFYGFWTCRSCGRENSGKDRNCNGCGHPRDKDTKFYPVSRGNSPKPREYIENFVDPGPDWNCSFCGGMNSATRNDCEGCGHTRDESDKHYFELHPERVEQRKNLSDFNHDSDAPTWDTEGDPIYRKRQEQTEDEYPEEDHFENTRSDEAVQPDSNFFGTTEKSLLDRAKNFSFLIKPALAVLALVALIIGLVFLLKPKAAEVTVIDKTWERNVVIEEYRTVHEEDWSIPIGGRQTGSHQEIHHYDTVLDHYETVTKSRTVQSGGHYEVTGYQDNGNGTFTEITTYVPDYTTETYTEQEPVYIQVPVYQTKYEYDIDKWQFDHYETTRGHTDRPYFAETKDLPQDFRTNGTNETYKITATYTYKNKSYQKDFKIDFDKWQAISIGDVIPVKIHAGNRLEFIEK